jgi:hypothetical protein
LRCFWVATSVPVTRASSMICCSSWQMADGKCACHDIVEYYPMCH